jgi:hypothetical protein
MGGCAHREGGRRSSRRPFSVGARPRPLPFLPEVIRVRKRRSCAAGWPASTVLASSTKAAPPVSEGAPRGRRRGSSRRLSVRCMHREKVSFGEMQRSSCAQWKGKKKKGRKGGSRVGKCMSHGPGWTWGGHTYACFVSEPIQTRTKIAFKMGLMRTGCLFGQDRCVCILRSAVCSDTNRQQISVWVAPLEMPLANVRKNILVHKRKI